MMGRSVQVVRTLAALRLTVADWKDAGSRIAVVPTMGALHAAHLTLLETAKLHAERTIVTIFVNPTQFNDSADLSNYPRTEAADLVLLNREGADLLFAPELGEMYPNGFSTKVTVSGVSEGLCGSFRTGHFDGVATVVAKLFNLTQADFAVFGEKDYQQLHVVRRMARDLDIPIEIIAHPTVRESDGLAMSSRNARLSPRERRIAPNLFSELLRAADQISQGQPPKEALNEARAALVAAGFSAVEYLELRAESNLGPLNTLSEPSRLLAAATLGDVRLIDNVRVAI